MMGGGNPSHIPEVQQFFHDKMQRVLDRPAEFAHMIGDYDSPQGDKPFIDAIAETVLNAFMRHASPQTTRKHYQNTPYILDGCLDQMFVPEIARKPR